MAVEPFEIVGSYNNQKITSIDPERTVNMFQYLDPLGVAPKCLIQTSGLVDTKFVFSTETGGFRQEFLFNGNNYCVVGSSVFRITPNNVIEFLGTITTDSGYVGIDANTFQVIFVDGEFGYIWDDNSETFEKITDTNFPIRPIDVCFLDGFFVVANGDTNNFQLSEFNQGMIWGVAVETFTALAATDILTVASTNNFATGVSVTLSTTGTLPSPLTAVDTYYTIRINSTELKLALTYDDAINNVFIDLLTDGTPTNTITGTGELQLGSITSHPGNIVACRTLHRRLFLFSDFYTEVWENAGIGTNLPFRRNNSLLIEYGTASIGSVEVGFDRMFFISQDRDGLGAVMQVVGTEAAPISNRALNVQLSMYAKNQAISDCRSFLIKDNGIIFYRMNFTKANHTFVYNVSMSDPSSQVLWHEEEVLNGDRHPAQTHAYINGINYVGDYKSPTLYIVDPTIFTNNFESIRRMRISRPMATPGLQRRRIDRFQLNLVQGTIDQINFIEVPIPILTQVGLNILTQSGNPLLIEDSLFISESITPEVFLSISRDGGQTFGYIIKAPMGKVGQRSFRTLWRKLGVIPRGQSFVVKIEFFNEIPFVVLGAVWANEVLPE